MLRNSTFLLTCAAGTFALMASGKADNTYTIRDCSFGSTPLASSDADSVQLSGATLQYSGGNLSVRTSQNSLVVSASESVDRGDSPNAVTLQATVSAPGTPTQTFFGKATSGFVDLGIPLIGSSNAVGRVYTITWHATFDGGGHVCPSSDGNGVPPTPSNMTETPFKVTVVK